MSEKQTDQPLTAEEAMVIAKDVLKRGRVNAIIVVRTVLAFLQASPQNLSLDPFVLKEASVDTRNVNWIVIPVRTRPLDMTFASIHQPAESPPLQSVAQKSLWQNVHCDAHALRNLCETRARREKPLVDQQEQVDHVN